MVMSAKKIMLIVVVNVTVAIIAAVIMEKYIKPKLNKDDAR